MPLPKGEGGVGGLAAQISGVQNIQMTRLRGCFELEFVRCYGHRLVLYDVSDDGHRPMWHAMHCPAVCEAIHRLLDCVLCAASFA